MRRHVAPTGPSGVGLLLPLCIDFDYAPFHFFFYMDPPTNYGGPWCYLQVSQIGPTNEDLAVFGPARVG